MYYDNNYYDKFICGDSPVTNKPFSMNNGNI